MFDLRPFHHERHAELDSTNSEALRRISAGRLTAPTIISATCQTDGRGSRRRQWLSHAGNVHASFAIPVLEQGPAAFLVVYPLALATSRTIREIAGLGTQVGLKWPNDVLVQGQKVSGSLHEVGWHDGRATLVAGIGINLRWAPAGEALFPPGSLDRWAADLPGADAVVERLGENIRAELRRWLEEGFDRVRDRYQAESCLLDQPISVRERRDGAEDLQGIYRGIGDDGALLLDAGGVVTRHYAVDVFPGLSALS
jgi:BirA family biotin operon repressor/biotin-[acetyl-CoA-carboxylase] ligase